MLRKPNRIVASGPSGLYHSRQTSLFLTFCRSQVETMIRRFLAGLVAVGALIATSPAYAEMKVGVGMRVITPDPLLPVSGGVGGGSPVKEKRGELNTRAMVFQNGKTTVAIVGLDLLGFPSVLAARVRKQVPDIP